MESYGSYTYSGMENVGSLAGGMAAGIGAIFIITMIIALVPTIIMLVSIIKIFQKAGKPGWAAIVPIYNIYIMCEIAEKPWWYLLLFAIPFANIYAMFVIFDGVAKKFGKSTGFTIGMMFIPIIFFPILGFGKSYMVEESITSYEESSMSNEMTRNEQPVMQNVEPVSQPTYEQPVMQNVQPVSQPMFEQPVMQNVEPVVQPMFEQPVMQNVEPVSQPMFEQPVMQNVEPVSQPMFEQPVMQNVEPVVQPTYEQPVIQETMDMIDSSVQSNVENTSVNQEFAHSQQHTSLWSNNNNDTQM